MSRSIETITQEYGNTCARAGALQYQITQLGKELAMINDTLQTLNLEAHAAKQEADAVASDAAKSVASSPALSVVPAQESTNG